MLFLFLFLFIGCKNVHWIERFKSYTIFLIIDRSYFLTGS